VSSTKLPSFVQTERRNDFPKWYNDPQDGICLFCKLYIVEKFGDQNN